MNSYKKYFKYIGHIFSIISLVFIFNILSENLEQLKYIKFTVFEVTIIFLLIFWGLLGYFIFAYTWIIQLKNRYPDFTYKISLKIIATTQIGKYLPGNIGHYIGRYYLSKYHLSKTDVTYSLFIENIVFLISYCIIGSIYLLFIDIKELFNSANFTIVFIGIFIFISLTIPFVFYIQKKLDIINLNLKVIIKLLVIFCILALLGGFSIYIIFFNILNITSINLYLCISAFSLSFLLGFIVPGAPGGIGVREYAFTLLLSPFIDEIYAIEAIGLFRIITICTDALLYLIGKGIKVEV